MTWPEGTSVVRYLLKGGKLDTIASKSASVAAQRNLERSKLRLTSARAARDHGDAEGSYALAYDAYRMVAEALLAQQCLRATGGEGGHVTVEDAAAAQFATEILAFAKPTFERIRRTRHTAQYFDPDEPDVTDEDAAWAVEQANDAVAGATRLLGSGRLDRFEA